MSFNLVESSALKKNGQHRLAKSFEPEGRSIRKHLETHDSDNFTPHLLRGDRSPR
jgi:hypothetical protein